MKVLKEYDFIVKLDADILLPLNYFKKYQMHLKRKILGLLEDIFIKKIKMENGF